MTAFAGFISELRASQIYAPVADSFAASFRELDHEAVHSKDCREFRRALLWVASQPRTLDEKMAALEKIRNLPPCHIMIPSLRAFLGW